MLTTVDFKGLENQASLGLRKYSLSLHTYVKSEQG